jgi:hypothetical protein
MKNIIFWYMTPCSPLSFNRRFGGTNRLHLPISSTPTMSAICSSETSVETERTTRCHIPEMILFKKSLFCDLNSSRHKSELSSSRLKCWYILRNSLACICPVRVKEIFYNFLYHKGNLVYSNKCGLSHGSLWPTT